MLQHSTDGTGPCFESVMTTLTSCGSVRSLTSTASSVCWNQKASEGILPITATGGGAVLSVLLPAHDLMLHPFL
jgi:uncharacterized protein YceK